MGLDEDMQRVVETTRKAFNAGKVRTYKQRYDLIVQIDKFLVEEDTAIREALKKDLGKPYHESVLLEIATTRGELKWCLDNLASWMKPQHASKPLHFIGDSAYIQPQPYGVVTLICPWNYPIYLLFSPLMGAIAAGNCVILKPSEVSPACEALIRDVLPKYLPSDCFPVVTGAVPETSALLRQRVDYIFYTGCTSVGRIIMKAAAQHLTPVTLELGGKCPTFVDDSSDLTIAANRIIANKTQNAGQACISNDYILCTSKTHDKLVAALRTSVEAMYGKDMQQSHDYGRIINSRHFDRLMKILTETKGRRVFDAGRDRDTLYMGLVVLVDVKLDDATMGEEIFGPILPIIVVENIHEAIEIVNAREKPLAAYIYAKDGQAIRTFEEGTTSGAIMSNDCGINMTLKSLPFGGVGESGIGAYHGKFTFDTFSHKRAVMHRKQAMEGVNVKFRYPPTTKASVHRIRSLLFRNRDSRDPKIFLLGAVAVFGMLLAGLAVFYQ